MGGRGSSSYSSKGSNGTVASKARRWAEKQSAIGDKADYENIGYQFPLWLTRDKTGSNAFYDARIERETEKAYLLRHYSSIEDRMVTNWVPKSQRLTPEAAREDRVKDMARVYENQYYGNYLQATAKDSGVKLGNMSSWDKIKDKLKKNGVSVMERSEFIGTRWTIRDDISKR